MNGKDYAAVNAQRRAPSQHRIGSDISYSRDHISCTCGWTGKAAGAIDYPAHRAAVGERALSLSTAYGSGRR